MTGVLARDSLTVFVGGAEAPGLIVYGLSSSALSKDIESPAPLWPGSPVSNCFVLHGDNWRVRGWEVPVTLWPTGSDFHDVIRRTLEMLIQGGCRVAWIGAEGVPFCDPPGLFDPEWMSGGVLAWMTDDGGFDCPLDPDRVLAPVSDDDLLALRTYARGLADVSNW